jgi:pimeloyl-ACP methyl ester carboxylesterase
MRSSQSLSVLLCCLSFLGFGLIVCQSQEVAVLGSRNRVLAFEGVSCWPQVPKGENPRCGYLTVPENRVHSTGRTIRLAVAIFRAHTTKIEPDPVVYLSGGPGAGALEDSEKTLSWLGPVRQNRDVIMFDQRGTGFSDPSMRCPEDEQARRKLVLGNLTVQEYREVKIAALLRCRQALVAKGVHLDSYNTAESAADVNDLREALGYDKLNLYGLSYGTTLGLGVMRDYPQILRSVILDSVQPFDKSVYSDGVDGAVHAYEVLFEGCAKNPACNKAYPGLKQVFDKLVSSLNQRAVAVKITGPGKLQGETLWVTGNKFAGYIFNALYDMATIPYLPRTIYEMHDDNYASLVGPDAVLWYGGGGIGDGMYYSVMCHDDAPMDTRDDIVARFRLHPEIGYPFYTEFDLGPEILDLCDRWGAGKVEPNQLKPVVSIVPALVLTGEYDPTTPSYWGKHTAETLTKSFYFMFPGQGHAQLDGQCAKKIAATFLSAPNISPNDMCLTGDKAGPDFVTR